jgi:hypothetical protein
MAEAEGMAQGDAPRPFLEPESEGAIVASPARGPLAWQPVAVTDPRQAKRLIVPSDPRKSPIPPFGSSGFSVGIDPAPRNESRLQCENFYGFGSHAPCI